MGTGKAMKKAVKKVQKAEKKAVGSAVSKVKVVKKKVAKKAASTVKAVRKKASMYSDRLVENWGHIPFSGDISPRLLLY